MGARERFIQDTLETEGKRLLRNQGAAISSAYRRGTGRLEEGRSISVTGGEGMDGRLTLEHPIYERFLDIKNHRRKRMRIHNRFIFGAYASIARRLMYGFTEEVAAAFRQLEENGNA